MEDGLYHYNYMHTMCYSMSKIYYQWCRTGGGAGGATAPPTFESGGGSAPPHFLDMKEIVSYFSMSATNGEQLNQNFCLRLHQKLSEHENTKKISGGHAPRPP